jgi:hypothetical protein
MGGILCFRIPLKNFNPFAHPRAHSGDFGDHQGRIIYGGSAMVRLGKAQNQRNTDYI